VIVVDTQIAVFWATDGPNRAIARRVHRRDGDWAAPRLWRSEFRNVILGYLRRGTLSFDEARRAFQRAADAFRGREHDVDTNHIFRLAARHPLTAYDLEFVVTAMRLDVPLVTFDRAILREFPDIAVDPQSFCDRT
jgi:predicted nucleic acid-binding protein